MGYCNPNQPKVQTRLGEEGKIRFVIRFHSYTYLSWNDIHSAWYVDGIKRVPSNIADFLTPLALAI